MEGFNVGESLLKLVQTSGIADLFRDPKPLIMIVIACVLLYLAIVKKYEPLLLMPIAFGMLLANLPLAGIMGEPTYQYLSEAVHNGKNGVPVLMENGDIVYQYVQEAGGLLYYLYQGVKLGIYPPLIFLGVGAMTDFGPLIANPKSLLLGAAAQLGIFVTFIICYTFLGFTPQEAASTGIIGGADGPTALYLTAKLAPHLLGPIAVAAYSYMALVPVIQPPIMRALTTKKERMIVMEQLRPVTKREKIIFPIAVTIIVSLLLPSAAPLVGMLMLGNLFRESCVVDRITKTAQNELMNIVTIFLGVTVGATASAATFLQWKTLSIIVVGVLAFAFGTAGGVLLAKLMNKISGGKINPLIGSAGVSAVPMAARVSQVEGQKANPGNFLLMHAMGPNVAGVIGSAIAAGILLSMFGG
ncbi:MAG: sodium ion-translocating decarboxylase subunit beta [Clostridia bacterium]